MARLRRVPGFRTVGYCVYRTHSGQTPSTRVKCFKTKKAAQRFARRESAFQVIPKRVQASR
jgi:hypothetical protein